MVLISHSVLLEPTLSGEKQTTWRANTHGTEDHWYRIREKLKTTKLEGQHYWKVRVPKDRKPYHYIGTSSITHIVERHIDTITLADAFLDGFRGDIPKMKAELLRLGGGDWYWQIYYTPNWGYRKRYRQIGVMK
ncbi:MAG: hypothetical protein GWP10_18640 [Nitrospiraceae bacterium]|nr:hypothetical protein [Nitrospiraceae bacterium]